MNQRETWIAYLLLIFGGIFGIHKFYLNRVGWGLAYLFTGGFFLIGCLIDLFTLPGQVRAFNQAAGFAPPPSPHPNATARTRRLAETEVRLDRLLHRLENVESVMKSRS